MEMYDGNSYKNDTSPGAWSSKYALLPKKVNGRWIWLKNYYWREVWTEYKAGDGYNDHQWRKEYGTIFDVLGTE
jgi:hypothetical protein